MAFDIDQALRYVVEHEGSDLHVKVPAPPMARIHGVLEPIPDMPVLTPEDEAKFETVTYTYYEQLNGYEYLKSLDIGYFFYTGRYLEAIMKVLDPALKTIVHIPNVNSSWERAQSM